MYEVQRAPMLSSTIGAFPNHMCDELAESALETPEQDRYIHTRRKREEFKHNTGFQQRGRMSEPYSNIRLNTLVDKRE